MIVTFCGHREVPESEIVQAWLHETVEELIREGADRFYLGGYGRFDALAAAVVREQKSGIPRSAPCWCYPILTENMTPIGTTKRSIRRWRPPQGALPSRSETNT